MVEHTSNRDLLLNTFRGRHLMLIGALGLLLGVFAALSPTDASLASEQEPLFIMPIAGPPGPDTWLLSQPYGNTAFAYRFRHTVYVNGQGMHFGVDFAAPCGTPVQAIGDGVVDSVDSWHGAGPHNLMINHPNGYASFYGHLLLKSHLKPGQKVQAGEVIALTGDPDLTCSSRPHLHLEIRSSNHRIAYNPMTLIDADWQRLALVGGSPQRFKQDLEDPSRWQDLFAQPEVKFGYPLLNDYESPWPLDW
jgi:murein DD-endopeptidase MepM/ murein hydrolase activator NlpD